MGTGAIMGNIDVAQIVLYVFWLFFAGLVFYLRREDRREGYPCESDTTRRVEPSGPVMLPAPKAFALPHGGEVFAPNALRYEKAIAGERSAAFAGAPLVPSGDPLLSGMGPAAYADRSDEPDRTAHGEPAIVPLRVATDFSIDRPNQDPRGLEVVGADGAVAGTVTDVWVDRADPMVRYLEVDLGGEHGTRLLPAPMMRMLDGRPGVVEVYALKASQFANVPRLANADQVTLLEEDKIGAYYSGGRLYADPKRLGPVL